MQKYDLIVETLKKNGLEVFKTKDIKILFGDKNTYNTLKYLKNKGYINLIKNGVYSLKDADEMVIGGKLFYPSYISFLSALNYYNLTEQSSSKIMFATTIKKKHDNYISIIIDKKRFFGYTSINNIIIADKEKAIIDSLYLPRYAGGIKVILDSIKNSYEYIDKKKLFDYAIKMNSKSIIRRLGFILEYLKLDFNYNLNDKIGKGYEILDPTKEKKNNYNKKWLLDVNL